MHVEGDGRIGNRADVQTTRVALFLHTSAKNPGKIMSYALSFLSLTLLAQPFNAQTLTVAPHTAQPSADTLYINAPHSAQPFTKVPFIDMPFPGTPFSGAPSVGDKNPVTRRLVEDNDIGVGRDCTGGKVFQRMRRGEVVVAVDMKDIIARRGIDGRVTRSGKAPVLGMG